VFWETVNLARLLLIAALVSLTASPATPARAGGFTVGLVSGPAASWEARMIGSAGLHPKVVRVPFPIGTPASRMRGAIASLAARGAQALPLAEFYGRIPSSSQARSLASWAHEFGPGGSFWRGRRDAGMAVRYIEFGNETNGAYQFGGCGPGCSRYGLRARQYALRLKDAQQAIAGRGGNPGVGLLAVSDDHGPTTWADNMYRAVPDLNSRVAGWTEHPYGPGYKAKMNNLLRGVGRHGGGGKPVFVTEFGISTDNGRCLSSNYGWPRCLTYAQAATDLRRAVADLHASYPQIAELFLFEQRDPQRHGATKSREGYFGAVQNRGRPKGAFTAAIRNLLNTYRG
jgi:hypothetical protein